MARELFQAALADHRAGRLAEAAAGYEAAIAADPGFIDAHINRGIVASLTGDSARALVALERAATLAPRRGDIAYNRGVALLLAHQPEAARGELERALALGLDQAQVHARLADVLVVLGDFDTALGHYGAAVKRDERLAAAWVGAAHLLVQTERYAQAVTAFETYLKLVPDDPTAWNLYGIALQRIGGIDEAVDAFRRAVALQPEYSSALNNLGEVLRDRLDFAPAVEALAAAAATAAPLEHAALCQLLFTRGQIADWRDFTAERDRLLAEFAGGTAQVVPFSMLRLLDDPAVHRAAAASWLEPLAHAPLPALPPPGPRLRIAYASADVHDHATMHLMGEMLAAHDRDRFEITLLSYGPPSTDAWRQRAQAAVDHFIEVGTETDAELAAMLRQRGIDVAVDLKGPTAGARPGILAQRAAPLQVNWLGYPGTMPMPGMDYLVGDAVVVPPAERVHIAEAVVTMPFSYQPNGRWQPLPAPGSRTDAGLPEQGFVFANLNQTYKILPEAFACWLAILAAVPGSVLWLWQWRGHEIAARNLRVAAAAAGCDPDRLYFAQGVKRPEHLQRLQHADLFLDLGPYGAHTTASDALRAGVPVLTLPGRAFPSRVAASLLTTLGLSELIATDAADYHARAVRLASDAAAHAAIKAKLAAAVATAPLYDPVGFCRAWESALAAMIERQRQGLTPADLIIGPNGSVRWA